ncbi:PleD family two-component system response regulator [Patescibacteria group bacterium]
MANKAKTILIIEDEAPVVRILREKFKSEGFRVLEAKNGIDGFKKAKTEKPDLILLDIILPKMDGIAMLQKLRKDAWGKNVKVIILTNLSDGDELAEAIEHKVHDYLVKADWKLEEIVKKVKEKLK